MHGVKKERCLKVWESFRRFTWKQFLWHVSAWSFWLSHPPIPSTLGVGAVTREWMNARSCQMGQMARRLQSCRMDFSFAKDFNMGLLIANYKRPHARCQKGTLLESNNYSNILLKPAAILVVFRNVANNFLSSAAGVPVIAISSMMGSLRFSHVIFAQ